MDRGVSGHRMKKSNVVYALSQVGKQIADPFSTLAVLLELPTWFNDSAFVAMATAAKCFYRDRLVVHTDHVGLVVKRVDLTWTTIHKQKDNRFGFSRNGFMGRARCCMLVG